MVPRAKKNLHECAYHLERMEHSTHVEELSINFAAFVNSARNITFVLNKEFSDDPEFKSWYGEKENPAKGTKRYEMANNALTRFFRDLRNEIVKEGTNGFVCSTHIHQFNSGTDMIDPPPNAGLEISGDGMYYRVNKGTPQEDRIPAKSRARLTTMVGIQNPPTSHLGVEIPADQRDVLNLSKKYYEYLKSIVEEWTGILNLRT